jgi:hypothetical protein
LLTAVIGSPLVVSPGSFQKKAPPRSCVLAQVAPPPVPVVGQLFSATFSKPS